MKSNKYLIVIIIIFPQILFAQTILSGILIDAISKKPISDANFVINNSRVISVSDSEGRFRFKTYDKEFSLKISKIGYEDFKNSFLLVDFPDTIFLYQSTIQIEEVEINTGYEIISKERATGSYKHLDRSQLNLNTGRSILTIIDGLMPGLYFDKRRYNYLEPDNNPQITTRGLNTFSTLTSMPLIIVDNIPFEGDLIDLHPEDIESVTLLKDASATSIWGARAGNGVLVINMKKNSIKEKNNLNYSTSYSINEKPNIYYQPKMSVEDFINLEVFLYEKDHYKSALTGSNVNRTIFTPIVQAMFDFENGDINKNDLDKIFENAKSQDYREDLIKYFYRNAQTMQHNISFSGSNNVHTWMASLGYNQNKGFIKNNKQQSDARYSFRISNNFKINERFTIESNINYHISDAHHGSSLSYPINLGTKNAYPYMKLVGENGEALSIPQSLNLKYIDSLSNTNLLDWSYRPYDDNSKINNYSFSNRIQSVLNLKYKFFNNLYLESTYNIQFENKNQGTLYDSDSYYVRDMFNRFTHYQNNQIVHPIPIGSIYSRNNSNDLKQMFRFQARMNSEFFEYHKLNWLLGSELIDNTYKDISNRYYGYNPELAKSVDVNSLINYPQWLGGTSSINSGEGFNDLVNRYISVYGNLSYEFYNRYIFSASARKDASNAFGVKTNERWNPLWSIGLSWNLKNENFLNRVYWIDGLRIKITNGHSGSLGGSTSDRIILNHVSLPANYTNLPFATVSSPPNPQLKWENVHMQNVSVEFELFNRRLKGSTEYYFKNVTDLVSSDQVDKTSGYTTVTRNVGGIKGEGLETHIDIKILENQFKWNTTMSMSYVKDWVTNFKGNASTAINYTQNAGINIFPVIGRPLQGVYSYKFEGLDPNTGDPLGYLNNAVSNNYSRILVDSIQNLYFHGSARPVYYGFLNNQLNYKAFSMFIGVSFRAGHYIRKETIHYDNLFNSWISHSDFERRWVSPGDEKITNIPSMVYPSNLSRDRFYTLSTATIKKGDVLRLDHIQVSYRFSNVFSSLRSCNMSLNVNNLGVIWSAVGKSKDPDVLGIPPSKSFTLSFNIQI